MSLTNTDRRALGAVRFVDAVTGLGVGGALKVHAAGVRWVRNRRGWFVIMNAPSVDVDLGTLLEPAPGPTPGSAPLKLEIEDPERRYLGRRCTIPFPRDPGPEADSSLSLFEPASVPLFPAPQLTPAPGWAVIRGHVAGEQPEDRLPGALILVRGNGDAEVLARALSDPRGEILVAVPGIPVTTWNEGDEQVLTTEVAATLEVIWDPAAERLPDPDDLEGRREQLTVRQHPVSLASGRTLSMTM